MRSFKFKSIEKLTAITGRKFIGDDLLEAPAYEGAKSSFLIEEKIENRKWLSELVRISEKKLPMPKPKKKKQ
ncbi:hypothetical protein [Dyadobacter sp. CY312]|uniref:hypothetical protein n=1 Tax=Dyadobacter sp. CY312 TaxID=2907303 RepID=UPI001F35781D|nr:hypothetical protein [Dyadobacter sp. CY312]MCE7043753.1 hypothetical protein [Dyadobacter sp. CY312]